MRSNSAKLLVLLLLPALAAGCAAPERHDEDASFGDEVQSLSIDVGSGDVTLRGGDVALVTVTARIEGPSNHLAHTVTDGHLALSDACHEDPCSVDITATLPSGVPVDLHTGSGDVTIDDMLGTLSLHTGSGDIEGWDLGGADLVADTGSGDVDLGVADPAERVQVHTGSGDVALDVPSGSYDLRIETGSGDRAFHAVTNDAAAPGTIEITTGSGDVTVTGR
jgi:hypothetical protein